MGFLKPLDGTIYALARILTGLLFLQHGLQKIFGLFGGPPAEAPAFIVYGAGGIELVGALLVAIGLFTAPAAFICSGTMAVAYFLGHVAPNPANVFLPILNGGELSILFCWMFLLIAVRGSGQWSVDSMRGADA